MDKSELIVRITVQEETLFGKKLYLKGNPNSEGKAKSRNTKISSVTISVVSLQLGHSA